MFWACTELHVLPDEFARLTDSTLVVLQSFFAYWVAARAQ